MPRFRVAAAARVLVAAALALTLAPAAARATAPTPDPAAGWHGRAIAQPQHDAASARSGRPLAGWSAGPVGPGTGPASAHGSRRVRELQKACAGSATGPGLSTGSSGPAPGRHHLVPDQARAEQERHGHAGHDRAPPRPHHPRSGTARTGPCQTRTHRDRRAGRSARGGGGFHWWPWIVAALAIALAAARSWRAATRPRRSARGRPRPRVLGYVRTPHDDDAAVDAHVAALERGMPCARGLALEGIDHRPSSTTAAGASGRGSTTHSTGCGPTSSTASSSHASNRSPSARSTCTTRSNASASTAPCWSCSTPGRTTNPRRPGRRRNAKPEHAHA